MILAGAILESFLLYWLGIKDDKDYFKTGYQIPVEKAINDSDNNSSNQRTQRPNYQKGGLADIINAIFDLPEYRTAKAHANQIREKRNWVHGERGIKAIIKLIKKLALRLLIILLRLSDADFPTNRFPWK